ncbi:unnamed protein product [Aureobasidium mustum]|uniref:Uncharacterized protein n=1 Tax=Aureobasidium mustum TaxID=2773714 RepID=A0A9N8PL00_9PEZI|nr:unnamed protein product [Aureobasidium mustum]
MKLPADDPEIVVLKRGGSYHAVIAETNRVKHALTMERPMPTATAALEYLLDITSEHLGNIHDTCFAGCPTPPTQFGETVENDLYPNLNSYYSPSLTPEAPEFTSSASESTDAADRESIESESPEQESIEITPPPSCRSVALADRLPTPFASPSPSSGRVRAPRRPASATEDNDTDDTVRGNALHRSTRIRQMRDQS